MNKSDFEYIYHGDGTCTHWYCGKRGAVLAYDDFSPECGHWFCQECWDDMGEFQDTLIIVEDRRDPQTQQARTELVATLATITAKRASDDFLTPLYKYVRRLYEEVAPLIGTLYQEMVRLGLHSPKREYTENHIRRYRRWKKQQAKLPTAS